MKNLLKMTFVETKLFFREPATWVIALLLPTFVLLILGALPSLRAPQAIFGGQRFIDVFVPSLMVITLATLGVNALPMRLATQREKGVLRRLSTTPVHPSLLLAAQLLINTVLSVVAVLLLIGAGKLAFGVPLPQNGGCFLAAFVLGLASVLALGLLIAAVAATSRTGAALSMPLYFLVMFLGGAYLPRMFLPDFLVTIGAYTPPSVQLLLDTWMGEAADPLQLAILALIALVTGIGAARSFRWE
jgi:ABC-2 type transport system permease protein